MAASGFMAGGVVALARLMDMECHPFTRGQASDFQLDQDTTGRRRGKFRRTVCLPLGVDEACLVFHLVLRDCTSRYQRGDCR